MLRLSLRPIEVWNEETEEFENIGGGEIELEHSLRTIAAWEAKHKKPFADRKGVSHDEMLDYIMNFMCQTPNVSKEAWLTLSSADTTKIKEYIEDPHTGTTIKAQNGSKKGKREVVTSELIYFYMAQYNIPFDCDRWHLNRLMTLIDVCAIKNSPPKKMSNEDRIKQQAMQNAALRKKYGSTG